MTNTSTSSWTRSQLSIHRCCSIALPFISLAGLVQILNVIYLDRRLFVRPRRARINNHTTLSMTEDSHTSEIVWLMSFPNSGTSYTLVNTEQLTGTTTATNYGVPESHDDPPVPVWPEHPFSPFWHSAVQPKPRRALTKTHCRTVLSYDEFEQGCRTITVNNVTGRPEEYQYEISLVAGAVHLIRHPLDNIVSRKHHMVRREVNTGILTADQAHELFPDTREGLISWCDYKLKKTRVWLQFPKEKLETVAPNLSSVPCYGDLLYYIQWHNLAAKTLFNHGIPSFVLYYEDYATNYNATVKELYSFIFDSNSTTSADPQSLPVLDWNKHVPFHDTKTYHELFSSVEKAAVEQAVKVLSSRLGWEVLGRYYRTT